MKKVLVTGAAGTIGLQVIKYLLSEGKYEIAALDLKNSCNMQKLKKYKNRLNVIYGDVCNRVLIEALVKDFDIIIHLAGVLPPLADIKKGLAEEIDYKACENITRAISYYNPKCHLFFASTMALGKNKNIADDYYNETKKNCENLIKEKLKYYTIYRFPLVLSQVKESLVLNGKKDANVYWITKEDAAYSLVKGLSFKDVLNKKFYNVYDGEILYQDLLKNILNEYGISMKYILNRLFVDQIEYNFKISEKNDLNEIMAFRNTSINDYYKSLRKNGKKRAIQRFFGKILVKGNIL